MGFHPLHTPHLVILAMGINDASTHVCNDLPRWRETYLSITRRLHAAHSTQAKLLCTIAPIANVCERAPPFVRSMADEMGADFYEFTFRTNSHPSRTESAQMARELAEFLHTLGF